MKLKELNLYDMQLIREWRNEQLDMLRTPYPLTDKQQEKFYNEVVCNRQSNLRYFGLWKKNFWKQISDTEQYRDKLIGMAGIENIQWENRLGEISLLFDPEHIEEYFEEGLKLILDYGFNTLNLENIYTEVYNCNPYNGLWDNFENKYFHRYAEQPIILPNRKYYQDKYYDSEYINFNKEQYNEIHK